METRCTVASSSSVLHSVAWLPSWSDRARAWPTWNKSGNIWVVCLQSIPTQGLFSSAASPTWASLVSSTKLLALMSRFNRTRSRPSPCTSDTPITSTCVGRWSTPPEFWTILLRSATPSRCRPSLPSPISELLFSTLLILASNVVSKIKVLL